MKLRLALCSILLVPLLPLLTACGESEKSVPSLEEVEAMTAEEATEALSGFRRQDILDAWGEPQDVSDTMESLRMDLYDAPPWAAGWSYSTTPQTSPTRTQSWTRCRSRVWTSRPLADGQIRLSHAKECFYDP